MPNVLSVAVAASALIADQMSAAGHLYIRAPVPATAAANAGHVW